MPNTHSFINTTRMCAVDVDAYNACGVSVASPAVDFDNGQLVTRGALQLTNATTPGGYEFAVTAPTSGASGLWVVDTPEAQWPIEMQIYDDPRYFYNAGGRPMSIRYLVPEVDFIEVPASAFATAPVAASKYATVDTDGRLVAAAAAPDSGTGTYFAIAGTHSIDIGAEVVTTYILQCIRN